MSEPTRDASDPVWGQLDLTFEQASRMLDQRLADVLRREGELDEQRTVLAERESVLLAKAAEARQSVTETEAQRSELEQREAALAARQAEVEQQPAASPVDEAAAAEAQRKLDERSAELQTREATLVEVAQRVQRSLAETAAERSRLEQGRTSVEESERKLAERLAEVTQREAGLAQERDELQRAAEQARPDPAEREELDRLRRREQELLALLAQREAALAQANETQRTQAELASVDARREIAALLAGVADRERLVAEREAHLEHALSQKGEDFDLEARAQWLTDAVKTAARQEAETVIKEANEQAQRILANARAAIAPPAPSSRPDA
jgi:hypothetical protein